MAERTSERWLTPVIVAVVGFLTGFFFVYLLRGSEPVSEEQERAVAASGAPEEAAPAAAPDAGPVEGAPSGKSADESAAAERKPGPASAVAAAAGSAAPPASQAPAASDRQRAGADLPAGPAPVQGEAAGAAPAAPASRGPAAVDPAAAKGPSPAKAAVSGAGASAEGALLGKPCTIEFGDIQALVVRQGDLQHGQLVNWKDDIGGRPRAGRIGRDENAVVTPLAFGYRTSGGKPTAAYVRVESGSRSFDGVIPLKIGKKHLELRPVEARPATAAPAR